MYNDSIDALLLRHYGHNGPTPAALEQKLLNSVRQQEVMAAHQEGYATARVLAHRMSRRRAMKLVAVGSAGLGLLGASLEVLDTAIFGENAARTTQSALS